jgi:xanthine dehydrogenase accessory factor
MDASEFGRLYASVHALEVENFRRPAALATIVRTFGSSFRRAGARMLVLDDGNVVCALSGGCPQHDIVERAKRVIARGCAEIARYNRDEGLDVLMEMGCGGELEVIIEPLRRADDTRYLHAIARVHESRRNGVLVTAFAQAEEQIIQRRFVRAGDIHWHDFDDAPSLAQATAYAGTVDSESSFDVDTGWLIEPIMPPQMLVLIGVNATSIALADIAAALGWICLLVQHTSLAGNQPTDARIETIPPEAVCERIPNDAACAVVVMTFNVERDVAYLKALASASFGYIGAIGSRERSARMREACAGVHLHAPAGLDLGAGNPQEIALAIAAEIVAERNSRAGGSMSVR